MRNEPYRETILLIIMLENTLFVERMPVRVVNNVYITIEVLNHVINHVVFSHEIHAYSINFSGNNVALHKTLPECEISQ